MNRSRTGLDHSNFAVALAAAILFALMTSLDAAAQESAQTHQVTISNFEFSPSTVTVKAGDTIEWLNQDVVAHTATAKDESWDTGMIRPNEKASMVVSQGQTLSYYCFYHSLMTANIKIGNSSAETVENTKVQNLRNF